ncbi:MAG: glycoside hydrolase family 11 protein [Bacteroidetes bacterium]|jgi:endo-1,4-beta-xylanase|nr:glycoside hydrolase family 11 protein [Bacteroidota bacterium]
MKLNKISICVLAILSITLVFVWGCQNQPTEPIATEDTQNELSVTSLKKTAGTGWDHGYFWSLYREGGSASITFPGAGTYAGNFAISYSNVNDVVGGKGWNPGSARNVNYNIGALSGSYNFVGVYGWTTNPLIEYYVAEKGSVTGGTYINSVTSDGHSYSVYKQQRVNAPSIIGTATFWQYKDTWGGASTGSNRTVTMSNHINNWKSRGGQGFGSYNYMIFALEAWGGKSGYINATVW